MTGKTYEILDVEKLDAANPQAAVKTVRVSAKPPSIKCDLLIAGGSMGGVAAALVAARAGLSVCITEETSWLGGQMTSQGVSALDENYLVESSGATRIYKELRNRLRAHYLALGGKEGTNRFTPYLDPGNCWVSRLAFEPKVAVKVLSEMLAPEIEAGRLKIFLRTAVLRLRQANGKIESVLCADLDTQKQVEFLCRFCIDATELGDLFPLAGIPYNSGAESRSQTGEEHAPEKADPNNVQDFTYPFVVEFCAGEKHLIPKPAQYDEFQQQGKFSLLGYAMFEERKTKKDGKDVHYLPFWEYRRLICKDNFSSRIFPNDIAMINWESNDLREENIIDTPAVLRAERLAHGKNLSMGFLYWMQNEMERDDGGKGYPELKLRSDILGTTDGVSKYPYIRESRRIKARRLLTEQDIVAGANPGARARHFADSLGIGLYPVDIHGKQDVPGAAQSTKPFQIPASAFLQKELRNFLPACKNIGTTHVSNGAYRLHPIEWAIGEAAGALAVEVLSSRSDLQRFLRNKRNLRRVQERIIRAGSALVWFEDISPEDECFEAVQFCSICSLLPIDQSSLKFRPDDDISQTEIDAALTKLLRKPEGAEHKQLLDELYSKRNSKGKIKRKTFAHWIYQIAQRERFLGRC